MLAELWVIGGTKQGYFAVFCFIAFQEPGLNDFDAPFIILS